MDIQQACEIIEDLLKRDTEKEILLMKEFNALNKILLDFQIKQDYEVKT